ncbi:MAG TPA: DUF2076 domain-containing protein [Pseudolabrys sp.]|jgi:hypothetical protein|nr:DUF2076 domain-containing protein [Pseudolabrys sp.]
MTPQERQLIDDLFDRLTKLESAPRDADAERAIADGLQRAPHAIYALVQTVLVQDEALRRADARIRELSGEDEQPRQAGGSFLDTMRSALGGGRGGSVPSVRPQPQQAQSGPDPRWNAGGAMPGAAPGPGPGYGAGAAPGYGGAPGYGAAPAPSPFGAAPSAGGSFLGTAAASAVGAIGGAMLFNSIGGLFGKHEGGSAFGSQQAFGGSPWDNNASGSDLSREAGFNDINGVGGVNDPQSAGLFGNNDDVTEVDETEYVDNSDNSNDDFGNDGGDFGGGTEDV